MGTRVILSSGLCLLLLPVYDFLIFSTENGVEVGVVYTDYYTYLRRMGLAGRFGTGVYIYVC